MAPETIFWPQLSTLCTYLICLDDLLFCRNKLIFKGIKSIKDTSRPWPLVIIIISFFFLTTPTSSQGLLSFISSSLRMKPIQGIFKAFQSLSPHALVVIKAVFSFYVMTEWRLQSVDRQLNTDWNTELQDGDSRVTILRLVARFRRGGKKKSLANVCDAKWVPQKAHHRRKTSKRSDIRR